MAFSGFATSAGPVVSSPVRSFGGFEELGLASQLWGDIGVTDDLRTPMVNDLGLRFLGA